MVEILEETAKLFCGEAGSVKRYLSSKSNNKPVMTAAQKRGYDMAIPYIKKYAKAMKVLGRC